MHRPSPERRSVAVLVAAALAVGPMVASIAAPLAATARVDSPVVHRYSLGSKVKLTTYRYAIGPEQVRVLTITQGASTLDIAPAAGTFGAYLKPSTIASTAYDDGTQRGPAIAATNGDFAQSGMPVHAEQIDGALWSSGLNQSPRFAVTSDASRAWIGKNDLEISVTFNGTHAPIDRWNHDDPGSNEIAAYSHVGGSVQEPPGKTSPSSSDPHFCAVRLVPAAAPHWAAAGRDAITRDYTVDGVDTAPCPQTPMNLGSDRGAIVLASRDTGTGADLLSTISHGDAVSITTKNPGWNGAVDSLGGAPMLVDHGVNVGPPYSDGDSYVFDYNPRTAIGFTAACSDTDPRTICKIYLVTVDGRQTDWSNGWRMNQLGRFFARTLDADYALNLDGGGGSVTWVDQKPRRFAPCITAAVVGCLVDRPSDSSGERSAVMALVAIPGVDRHIPKSLR
jgi:phosphodiester glycosidase